MPDVREQRSAALAKANAVRERNARLKRDLKSGTLSLANALEEPALQQWPAADVIGFAQIGSTRWRGGPAKPAAHQALLILSYASISHRRPVSDLTRLEKRLILDKARTIASNRIRDRRPFTRPVHQRDPRFLN
jgi:hypothetical protein